MSEPDDYFKPGKLSCHCGRRAECSSWQQGENDEGVVVVYDVIHECSCGRRAIDYLWNEGA